VFQPGSARFKIITACLAVAGLCAPAANAAAEPCEIVSDGAAYAQARDRAVLLLQHGQMVLRATDGKIRCSEDASSKRQICAVDGPGEMLIEGGNRAPRLVRLTTQEPGEVHVYDTGDLSCGLKSEFDKYR